MIWEQLLCREQWQEISLYTFSADSFFFPSAFLILNCLNLWLQIPCKWRADCMNMFTEMGTEWDDSRGDSDTGSLLQVCALKQEPWAPSILLAQPRTDLLSVYIMNNTRECFRTWECFGTGWSWLSTHFSPPFVATVCFSEPQVHVYIINPRREERGALILLCFI